MNNVALIIDSSPQYIFTRVRDTMLSWGIQPSEYKTVNEWIIGIATARTMFGKPKAIHLDLSAQNDFKKFNELYKKDKAFQESLSKDKWWGTGVIITTTIAKGSQGLEKIVSNSNGTIIKKRKPEEVKEELLSELSLSNSHKKFLSDYVGEDYDLLLNCVKNLKNLSKEDLNNVTIDDLTVYLPVKKGSIPPWDFINSLVKLNAKETLDNLRRTLETQHPLIVMTFLKRKIEEMYHDKVLMESGVGSFKDRAEIIKSNPWSIKNLSTTNSRLSLETLESLVYYINSVEDKLKGGGNILDSNTYMESVVSKVLASLKFNFTINAENL